MFQRNKYNRPKNKTSFNHIQCRYIASNLDQFQKDPTDETNRHVTIGFYTIDFKDNTVYQTLDPANKDE